MNPRQVKAYGTFIKRDDNIYRTSAYIQWEDSTKSLGACLLLNPGSAALSEEFTSKLHTVGSASGLIDSQDQTMKQLIQIVEGIYSGEKNLSGRFHIYNLFNLQSGNSVRAIDKFENLCNSELYNPEESLVSIEELMLHPWIILGWGVEYRSTWTNLKLVKEKWLALIRDAEITSFGKEHKNRNDYYHVCPQIMRDRLVIANEIISLCKHEAEPLPRKKINVQRFSVYATKPNLIVDMNDREVIEGESGWRKSPGNPENIVKSFSQLSIKEGYKLRAYQYRESGNGNGIVWAMPSEREFPEPGECTKLENYFLSPPKPPFALDDFMVVIAGDKSPLSYLQASIVYHELHEYGAEWHGVSWGRDVILPVIEDEDAEIRSYNYEWKLEEGESEPEIIEPHFYYNERGNPVVVFCTINDIGTVVLKRYEHVFDKDAYTLSVNTRSIATAEAGIIF